MATADHPPGLIAPRRHGEPMRVLWLHVGRAGAAGPRRRQFESYIRILFPDGR